MVDFFADWISVASALLQGSVLGPLMFVLYILLR